jgi:hypothetical protein
MNPFEEEDPSRMQLLVDPEYYRQAQEIEDALIELIDKKREKGGSDGL